MSINSPGSLNRYKSKIDSIKPYTSIKEKDTMLMQMSGEKNPVKIAESLGYHPINRFEAIAMIFKAREVSVSDLIDITLKCSECNHLDMKVVNIPDMFYRGDIDESIEVGLFESLTEIDDEEVINNLSISEYNEYEQKIFKNNLEIFNPLISLKCSKCNHVSEMTLDPSGLISKFSLSNIYEQYLDISYFSHMTKADVDNMYPFEREVFIGLIQKKEDEKNPKKK